MSELWVIGILLVAIQGLLGLLVRGLFARLKRIEDNSQSATLAGHISRFEATEGAWNTWRDELVRERAEFRAEVMKRLDAHAEDLKELAERVTRLERNGH